MSFLIRVIDGITEITGKVAAWTFFAIGLIVTYEVVLRHVFNAPTIWVDDVARYGQIWATYIAGAYVLKHREMITIEVAFKDPITTRRKLVETFAILVIVFFCVIAVWYGAELWYKSLVSGKRSSTMLAAPFWATQSAIWVGFGLLMLQAAVELIRVWTVGIPASKLGAGAH